MNAWCNKLAVFALCAMSGMKFAVSDTCVVDGVVFDRGQNLGDSFVTRCGSAVEFPCFCNPDLKQKIDCPYCGFATQGDGLLCARDNEVVSFVDLEGDDRTCACSAPRGQAPTFDCDFTPKSSAAATCTFKLPDGSTKTFGDGESLGDFYPNVCGSNFPCKCNPFIEGQIECPYCRFPSSNGDLVCARDGESVSFVDTAGVDKSCTCSISPDDPNDFSVDCRSSFQATEAATCQIRLPDGTIGIYMAGENLGNFRENRCGSDFPCFCNPDVPGQIECPYCRFVQEDLSLKCARNGEFVSYRDRDGIDMVCSCEIPADPTAEPITSCIDTRPKVQEVCTKELENGEVVTFTQGESYGDYLTTRCDSPQNFPCFCNPSMWNQIECPYCGFLAGDGILHCARDDETISFKDGSITRTCSCEIPDDPSQDPIGICEEGALSPTSAPSAPIIAGPPNTCSFENSSGEIEFVEDGNDFGVELQGVCGSGLYWPYKCDSSKSVISTISGQEVSGAVYPYCIFDDTPSNNVVCARAGEQVEYVNQDGVSLVCGCVDTNSILGLLDACQPVTNTPTLRPVLQPRSSSADSTITWTLMASFGILATYRFIF